MNHILSRLKEISSAVLYASEGRDLEHVLERIAEAARELAGTKYAALGVPDGKDGLRYFKTAGMSQEEIDRIPHYPRGHGLLGAIMHERRVILQNDMQSDPRSSGFPDNHPEMHSFLGAPIMVSNRMYGMLYLSDKEDGTLFNEEDKDLVEMLAGYAALAISGAELSERDSRLRLLEERERIGMELHDGIIQSLYGIGMQVDLMRRGNQVVENHHLSELIDDLNDVIEDIRGFIVNLRTRDNPLTIHERLVQMKDRLHPPADIQFEIDAPDEVPPFTPAVFESICLIINEAMSNAIRHAGAKTIRVEVKQSKTHFHFRVSDDGSGFDTSYAQQNGGLGLRNMQRRARLYGGEIALTSKPGKGTDLAVDIPVGSY